MPVWPFPTPSCSPPPSALQAPGRLSLLRCSGLVVSAPPRLESHHVAARRTKLRPGKGKGLAWWGAWLGNQIQGPGATAREVQRPHRCHVTPRLPSLLTTGGVGLLPQRRAWGCPRAAQGGGWVGKDNPSTVPKFQQAHKPGWNLLIWKDLGFSENKLKDKLMLAKGGA